MGELWKGKPFSDQRKQLKRRDRPVAGHAPENLEQKGMRVPHEEGMPSAMGKTYIEDKGG